MLDTRRLGKQRVETLQVLRALTRPTYGWQSHPVVRMWRGYESALIAYGLAVTAQWASRGFADTCAATIVADALAAEVQVIDEVHARAAGALPHWLGDDAFHRSHQSALVRKAPAWYRRWFPDVADDLPYVWPTGADGTPPGHRSS